MTARACVVLFLLAASANADRLEHTFVLTLNHSSGATLAIPPSITALEVTAPEQASGPLYQGQTTEHTNPLFESAAAPGSPGSVISVGWEFAGTKSSQAGNGIVHRDIATRNVLVTTTEGVYELDPAAGTLFFQNDGPPSLRGVGPVRWMAPESVRTHSYTPTATDGRSGYWELAAFSYFDARYPVPEPTAAVLAAGLWGVLALRRRR